MKDGDDPSMGHPEILFAHLKIFNIPSWGMCAPALAARFFSV